MKTPSQKLTDQLLDSRNFIALAAVIINSTAEANVFRLLLDEYHISPEGLRGHEIEAATGLTQSVVSNSLRKLRKKKVVNERRAGQEVFNTLAPGVYEGVTEFTAKGLAFK